MGCAYGQQADRGLPGHDGTSVKLNLVIFVPVLYSAYFYFIKTMVWYGIHADMLT